MHDNIAVHYAGRYLKLIERNGWEFATRRHPVVAVLVAWTDDAELLLVEQYREPVERRVVELPAGLVGDVDGHERESVLSAAARELVEETGYRAQALSEIMRCPTTAGMSDETAVFVAADGLERVGPGGGDASEDITVHRRPLEGIDDWLRQRQAEGIALDTKIFTALYWRLRHTGTGVR